MTEKQNKITYRVSLERFTRELKREPVVTLEKMNQLEKSANGKCDYNLVLLTNKKAAAIFFKRKINIGKRALRLHTQTHSLSRNVHVGYDLHPHTQLHVLSMTALFAICSLRGPLGVPGLATFSVSLSHFLLPHLNLSLLQGYPQGPSPA